METNPTTRHDAYHIAWSDEDREYAATVDGQPGLSWLAPTPTEALHGIIALMREVDADMARHDDGATGCA